MKNEDTNGESATPQRPGSAIKSARPRTGTYQSLLDNAPNYLVGCIIQKRRTKNSEQDYGDISQLGVLHF